MPATSMALRKLRSNVSDHELRGSSARADDDVDGRVLRRARGLRTPGGVKLTPGGMEQLQLWEVSSKFLTSFSEYGRNFLIWKNYFQLGFLVCLVLCYIALFSDREHLSADKEPVTKWRFGGVLSAS